MKKARNTAILLFGVSNVGKTTTGRLLADQLNAKFYDLDEEIKTAYGMTLEMFTEEYNDHRERAYHKSMLLEQLIRNVRGCIKHIALRISDKISWRWIKYAAIFLGDMRWMAERQKRSLKI